MRFTAFLRLLDLSRFWLCASFPLLAAGAAQGQVVTTIYSFGSKTNDGTKPTAGLVLGADGNFYGAASAGGTLGKGAIFAITAAGVETPIYSFTTNSGDGNTPNGPLVQVADGTLYGTTLGGGPSNNGTIFKISTAGAEATLYTFPALGGFGHVGAQTGLTLGVDGNLYGTTMGTNSSGANSGTVFRITPSGTFTTLYSFGTNSNDGSNPDAALVQGNDGNFYGTTARSSVAQSGQDGIVFKVTPEGVESVLYSFGTNANDGTWAQGAMIQGNDGNFYGTTRLSFTHFDFGAIFKITPSGVETPLYAFGTLQVNGLLADGANPYGALWQGPDGNLYGTTSSSGAFNKGTLFRITPTGVFTLLYTFGSKTGDGSGPQCALVPGPDGNLYGTTALGGSANSGTVFRVALHPTITPVSIASSNSVAGLAKESNVLTVSFTADETITTPTVLIAGRPAAVTNPTGNKWVGTIPVTRDFPEGPVAFSISATDVGGYPSGTISSTTEGSSVSIDLQPPVISQVSIASNNANAAYAKIGDTVTVSFVSNEPIQTPSVTIAGQPAAVTSLGGNLWRASAVVTSSMADGPAALSITALDLAGNAAAAQTAPTDGSSVTLELTPPTLTPATIVSSNPAPGYARVGDVVTLVFFASGVIQNPVVTIAGQTASVAAVSGGYWTASLTLTNADSEGPAAFSIVAKDLAGNVTAPTTGTTTLNGAGVLVDFTPPTLNRVTLASTNSNPQVAKAGDTIVLSFTALEAIQPPTVLISNLPAKVLPGAGNAWTASAVITDAFPAGPTTFSIAATDLAGNAAPLPVTATTDGSALDIKLTPPLLNAVSIASTNADPRYAKAGDTITINFTANQPIQTPTVSVAGLPAVVSHPAGNNFTASITATTALAQGVAPFSISVADLAGNLASVTATTDASSVTIDPVPATLSVVSISTNHGSIPGLPFTPSHYANVGDDVSVEFIASQALKDPVVTIAGKTAAISSPGNNFWYASVTIDGASPQGPVAFSIAVTDLAGNVSPPVTAPYDHFYIIVDTIPPLLHTGAVPLRGYVAGQPPPDLRSFLSASDTNGPVALRQFYSDGQLLIAGLRTVTFSATDLAHNSTVAELTIFVSPAQPDPGAVATKGSDVTGQSGAKYTAFSAPETGPFAGKLTTDKKATPAIFAADGSVLLQVGETIAKLGQPSGDAVLATLKSGAGVNGPITAANNVVLFTGLTTGAPLVAAQTGTPASGLPSGVTIKKFGALDGHGATPFFLATLQGEGVTPVNSLALCSLPSPDQVNVLLRRNDYIGSNYVSSFSTLVGSPGTLADERWRADDSTLGVLLTFSDQSQAIYNIPASAASPADWTLDAQTGPTTIPGLSGNTISSFGLPGFGPQNFAVLVHLAPKIGDTTTTNKSAIITGRAGAAPTLLIRQGRPVVKDAAGLPLTGVTVKTLSDPIVGFDASVAFLETLNGFAPPATAGAAVAYAADGQQVELLANSGAPAPGGGHWRNFSSLVLPKEYATGPIFSGTLLVNAYDSVTPQSNAGIWGVDVTGALQSLLRTGQMLQIGGIAKKLTSFTGLTPAAGSIGSANGYDRDGNLAVLAKFQDHTQSLIQVAMP